MSAGKGDVRRPRTIGLAEWDDAWERTFGVRSACAEHSSPARGARVVRTWVGGKVEDATVTGSVTADPAKESNALGE